MIGQCCQQPGRCWGLSFCWDATGRPRRWFVGGGDARRHGPMLTHGLSGPRLNPKGEQNVRGSSSSTEKKQKTHDVPLVPFSWRHWWQRTFVAGYDLSSEDFWPRMPVLLEAAEVGKSDKGCFLTLLFRGQCKSPGPTKKQYLEPTEGNSQGLCQFDHLDIHVCLLLDSFQEHT